MRDTQCCDGPPRFGLRKILHVVYFLYSAVSMLTVSMLGSVGSASVPPVASHGFCGSSVSTTEFEPDHGVILPGPAAASLPPECKKGFDVKN